MVLFHTTTGSAMTQISIQVGTDQLNVADVWVTHAEPAPNLWTVELVDNNCDNYGVTWYAHNTSGSYISFTSEGCHSDAFFTVNRTSIGSPFNWWISLGGTNSSAQAFPSAFLPLTNGSISHTKVSPKPTFSYSEYAQDNGSSTSEVIYSGSTKVAEMHMYNVDNGLEYEVVVADDRCDSTGLAWHAVKSSTSTWTLPTAGCGTRSTYFLDPFQISTYWWVEWGGYNSTEEGNPVL